MNTYCKPLPPVFDDDAEQRALDQRDEAKEEVSTYEAAWLREREA